MSDAARAKADAKLLEAAWSVKLPFCDGGPGCRNHGPCRPHAEIVAMLAAWTTKHMESLQHEVSILRTTCDAHITVIGDKEDEIKTLREENTRLRELARKWSQSAIGVYEGRIRCESCGSSWAPDKDPDHTDGCLVMETIALLADPEGQRWTGGQS